MPTNNLTDAKCKSARPAEKDYKLFDGGGLHLFVTAKGAKTWRLAYRVDGKQKTMSFGPYPQVSLAEARKKRDDAKGEIRAGDDPMAPRRAKKQAVTFADSVADFWAGRKDVSPSYRQNALRGLEMHLLPNLGGRAVSEISRDDLLTELKRMDAAGKHVYVRKVRMWADQVFDWAVENGLDRKSVV